MEIQQLRYYVEIVDCQNFTKAAERLLVTQPMLTRVIKQLEGELGAQLIERSNKHFRVTDAGRALYQQARGFLVKYEDIGRAVEDIKKPRSGEVRLSIPGVILDVYFSRLLRQFYEEYPGIDIDIVEEGSKRTVQAVLAGRVDMGLVMMPVACDSLESHRVVQSDCRLVVAGGHKLAGKRSAGFAELRGERIITFGDTATLHDSFVRLCQQEGFTPHISYKSLMPNFIFEIVQARLASAVLPAPVFARFAPPGLVAVPFAPAMPWDVAVITRGGRYQSYAATQLMAFMREYFAGLGDG